MTDQFNPCFECGQCCQFFRVSFYHGEIEGNNVGTVPPAYTSKVNDHLACMKGTESGQGKCIALEYSKENGYRCKIYALRPSPCREFELYIDGKPNPKCNELRMAAGLNSLPEVNFLKEV
jgi:Fe-S-cluster containining protein